MVARDRDAFLVPALCEDECKKKTLILCMLSSVFVELLQITHKLLIERVIMTGFP